jgi:hypothetical protein
MKKITAFLLIFIFFFDAAAYASIAARLTAYDIYVNASNAVTKEKSYKIRTDGQITIEVDGEATTTDNLGYTAVIITDDGLETMSITLATDSEEQVSYEVTYLRDRILYTDSENAQTKQKVYTDGYYAALNLVGQEYTFPKNMIKDESIEAGDDGKQLVSYTIDNIAMNELPFHLTHDLFEYAELLIDVQMSFQDMEVDAVINSDGILESMDVVYEYTITQKGQRVRYAYDISIEITQIGDVSIFFPGELEDYQEITIADYTTY